MSKKRHVFLLCKYFNLGWLERQYFDGKRYHQPYSAEDRLHAGELFYADFLSWQRGTHLSVDYSLPVVDVSRKNSDNVCVYFGAERFRRALKRIPKVSLMVVYRIVLNEDEFTVPKTFNERERLRFNDEIKGLLCRGLDELCSFYQSRY